jgi:hypothetical protein
MTFAIVGWYYINNVKPNQCSDHIYKASICVLFSIYCAFIAISTVSCKSSDHIRNHDTDSSNGEIYKTCRDGLIIISIIIYIVVMVFGIQLFMIDCMRIVGLIVIIEIYVPIITFLFIIVVLLIITLCYHIINKKKRSRIIHPQTMIYVQPKSVISPYLII